MSLFSPLMTIFFIILLGVIFCKKKLFNKSQIEGFELFLFKIIMPSYLFAATYKYDLPSLMNIKYITAYLISFLILAVIVIAIFIKKATMSVIYIRIFASGYINAAIYGLPIIVILLKDPTAAIIGNIIQVIIIQPILMTCLNVAKHKGNSLSTKILNIITTPIVMAPITGIFLNYFCINLPFSMIEAVVQIGSGASGLALFVFGLTLGTIKITKKCLNFDLLCMIFLKNICHPVIAVFVSYFIKLESYWFYSLIIATSAPTAFIVYLISKQFSIEEEMIKKTIALSSLISIISLIFITITLRKI